MKIRSGYVSNSSSSSFCIVGIVVNSENIGELFGVTEGYDYDSVYDFLDKNVDLHRSNGIFKYYDSYVVGREIEDMRDDQTLDDFKNEIFGKLKEAGFTGSVKDIGILVDGGYNG